MIGYKGRGFIQQKIIFLLRSVEKSYPEISQYKEINCPENSINIATFGQSNSANDMTEQSDLGYHQIYTNMIGNHKSATCTKNHF